MSEKEEKGRERRRRGKGGEERWGGRGGKREIESVRRRSEESEND